MAHNSSQRSAEPEGMEVVMPSGRIQFFIATTNDNVVLERVRTVGKVVLTQQRASNLSERVFHTANPTLGEVKRLGWDTISGMKSYTFPFGPKKVTYNDFALEYSEVTRPGKKPLMRSLNPKNRTITMNAVVADRSTGGTSSIEDELNLLKDLAGEDYDLTFQHGGVMLPHRVRITRLQISSVQRALGGDITQAKVDITLRESEPLYVKLVHLAAVLEEPEVPGETADEGDESLVALSPHELATLASTGPHFIPEVHGGENPPHWQETVE
jgi:hypothetical protein